MKFIFEVIFSVLFLICLLGFLKEVEKETLNQINPPEGGMVFMFEDGEIIEILTPGEASDR